MRARISGVTVVYGPEETLAANAPDWAMDQHRIRERVVFDPPLKSRRRLRNDTVTERQEMDASAKESTW